MKAMSLMTKVYVDVVIDGAVEMMMVMAMVDWVSMLMVEMKM